MIWLMPLLGMLGKIPGMLGEYFTKKQEIEKARIDKELQIQLANAQLQSQIAESESNLQITALNATSSLFKEKTFWFLSVPMILSIVIPSYADTMWHNLEAVPEFYQNLYCGMVCAIWGLPRAMDWLGKSREYKLAKIEAVNRSKFYAEYREKYGAVDQKLVDKLEPIFDDMDKDS